jgi:hypothetical protein
MLSWSMMLILLLIMPQQFNVLAMALMLLEMLKGGMMGK